MTVHEILKYPSLEFVLGLELDQGVVRSSFRNSSSQPHFEDARLQWWFGDAAKSLLMLPQVYYQSFDLVLMDLANDVIDFLMVMEDLGITNAAMLLMKPDGVIVRDEDWEFASTNPLTKYTVDLFYVDVPSFAIRALLLVAILWTLSATQVPKDHGVEIIYLKPVNEMENHFKTWYNY